MCIVCILRDNHGLDEGGVFRLNIIINAMVGVIELATHVAEQVDDESRVVMLKLCKELNEAIQGPKSRTQLEKELAQKLATAKIEANAKNEPVTVVIGGAFVNPVMQALYAEKLAEEATMPKDEQAKRDEAYRKAMLRMFEGIDKPEDEDKIN